MITNQQLTDRLREIKADMEELVREGLEYAGECDDGITLCFQAVQQIDRLEQLALDIEYEATLDNVRSDQRRFGRIVARNF